MVYPNNKGLQTTYALGFDAGFDAAVVKLLKWAEKQKRKCELELQCSNDDADRGKIDAYQMVIDKLNEM